MNRFPKISLLSAVLFPVFLHAQTILIGDRTYKIKNPENLTGKAFYDFTYIKDTSQPEHPYKETMELDFGKNSSMFFSYSKKESDSSMYADMLRQVKTAPDPNQLDLVLHGSSFVSSDMYYTEDSSQKVYTIKPIASALYYVQDTQPPIQWKIVDSVKKTAAGYLCQKAVGESHGRIYTAWFCSDLPYNFGPRKLYGLPGLILEAHDEKKEIVYNLSRLILPVNGETGLPENAMPATEEEYKKVMAAFKKNPAAFMGNLQGRDAGIKSKNPLEDINSSKIKSISVIKETPYGKGVLLKENNPIDLK